MAARRENTTVNVNLNLGPSGHHQTQQDPYLGLESTLDNHESTLINLMQQQRQVESQAANNATMTRKQIQEQIHQLDEVLDDNEESIRNVWAQQEKILNLITIQNQLEEQDREIQTFIDMQKLFLETLHSPLQAQVEAVQALQRNQDEMMRQIGMEPETIDFMSDPLAPLAHEEIDEEERQNLERALQYTERSRNLGGLTPIANHNPNHDAKTLRKAMRGLGTNEKNLVTTIGSRSRQQRLATSLAYSTNYRRDLLKDIKSETSGNFRRLLKALLLPLPSYDAHCVYKAVKGLGTDDNALIEVVCSRTNTEILEMKDAYREMHGRDIDGDVRGDTSGTYQALLLALLRATRDETYNIDFNLVKEDAANLYAAGEGRAGTNENMFIEILTQRNEAHLRAVFDQYAQIEDYDIEKSISREASFNFKKALLALVRSIKNRPKYFAELLHEAMKGMGTDNERLVRIVASRSELDLYDIAKEYRTAYSESLEHRIGKETSGNFKKLLIELFGEEHFDAELDAKRLRKAMFGWGARRAPINKIAATRTLDQKEQIVEVYRRNFKRDLLKDLQSELRGNHKKLVLALMMPIDVFLAREVRRAVQGLGTDDRSLIEIICSRSGAEMERLREAYADTFGRDMGSDVGADTSGSYKLLLLSLINSKKNDFAPVNTEAAMEAASQLYKAGEEKIGTDEAVFIKVLTENNWEQLRVIFEQYSKLCDYDIEKSITRETSLNFKRALVTIVRMTKDPHEYFATRLYKSMKGLGTEDEDLIRLMVSRAEIDLKEIGDAFFKKYKASLESWIVGDTSFHFKKLLIRILDNSRRNHKKIQMAQREHVKNNPNAAMYANAAAAGYVGQPMMHGMPGMHPMGMQVTARVGADGTTSVVAGHEPTISGNEIHTQHITFEAPDSDAISMQSLYTLDYLAQFINAHPEIKVVDIQVNVGDLGRDKRDERLERELSQRRAKAIEAHLIGKGVEDRRLEATGQGDNEMTGEQVRFEILDG